MEVYEYPKLKHQIDEHNKIKNDLQNKVEKIKQQEESLGDLILFLMQWFLNHTKLSDKDIGTYMKQYNKEIYAT